ncbi:hypothetical protein RF55_953 [Lasius niger]|uniref:Uncharacterized protein n=1 Tax=Lasius niger TaxID=67767 RepID=A0A0J7P2C9_LASNI|nr:hypothetical protein RF55_953 [Lasius niger]
MQLKKKEGPIVRPIATNYLGLKPKVEIKMAQPVPLWKLAAASGPYVKLAAISGAAAVILGAVGSHNESAFALQDIIPRMK